MMQRLAIAAALLVALVACGEVKKGLDELEGVSPDGVEYTEDCDREDALNQEAECSKAQIAKAQADEVKRRARQFQSPRPSSTRK